MQGDGPPGADPGAESNPPVTSPSAEPQTTAETQPVTVEADWTQAFDGLQGTAVLFDPAANRYWIYNEQMADRRRSPCSTFKIIAALDRPGERGD